MPETNLRRMVERLERTGTLGMQPDRGCKRIEHEQIEEIATVVMDQAIANKQGTSSASSTSKQMGILLSTVQ